jgi:hypothetical protein
MARHQMVYKQPQDAVQERQPNQTPVKAVHDNQPTSISPCIRKLGGIKLQKLQQRQPISLARGTHRIASLRRTRARAISLTSSTCSATRGSLVSREGSCQLLTSYHHRRIRLPSVRPLSDALRFQYRQPESASVHSVPWTRGRRT